jgi:hypothetical protein
MLATQVSPWRPRPLAGGALLSLLAHAALIAAWGWHAAAPRVVAAGGSGRPAILWLKTDAGAAAPSVPAPPAAVVGAAVRHAPPRHQRPAAMPRADAPTRTADAQAAQAAPAPAPAASEPVRGIAFAVPAIDLGLGPASRGALRAGGAGPAAPAAAHGPPPEVLAQAARQAGLAHIAHALQQRLAELQAPQAPAGGECTPADDPASPLACDNGALQDALRDEAPALAGLLRAYRGLDPRLQRVALSYTGQGFRLDAR